MALLHIPLADIGHKHFQGLIDAGVSESRNIEYKRDLYGNADADHAEWLADVSSFANAAGGDIVFGMEASKGLPIRFAPLTADLDQEIQRLEQIAQANLQPRLQSLHFKTIALPAGGQVLLVRVSRSYNPPHRIVRQGKKGDRRFWARSSAGKYEPNVDELRALFTLAPQLGERMRDWRFNRIAKITVQDTAVRLMYRTCLIMHIVPFSSFDPGALVSLADIDKQPYPFPPIGSSSVQHWQVNFDGVLLTSNAEKSAPEQRAYTQVYRSGAIEAVASTMAGGDAAKGIAPSLRSIDIEGQVLLPLVKYLKGLNALGAEPPFALMVSLVGVKGVQMNVGVKAHWADDDDLAVLDRDQYHFGEVILNSVPSSIQESAVLIRPFIEQLANTAGKAASTSFGSNGEYLHAFQYQ
jgi:hypothetical protein